LAPPLQKGWLFRELISKLFRDFCVFLEFLATYTE
jgi:hypothetical protein